MGWTGHVALTVESCI